MTDDMDLNQEPSEDELATDASDPDAPAEADGLDLEEDDGSDAAADEEVAADAVTEQDDETEEDET